MNVLNRGIAILLSLAIIIGTVVVIFVASGDVDPADLPEGMFRPQIEDVSDASSGSKAIIITASIAIFLVMLGLLYLELRPVGRQRRLLISSGEEGVTTITEGSIEDLADNISEGMREVRHIKCRIALEKEGLMIRCNTSVKMGTNLPELCAELQSNIKMRVEEVTGLPVASVSINARYERAEGKRLAAR
ncbi:MAG: alkaline shock response membrane anchor protein AmaP [Chloroflexota bacterium]|nr:alkaline shock response membrane anchor protein AmaP [Chloroflexota bacterium]